MLCIKQYNMQVFNIPYNYYNLIPSAIRYNEITEWFIVDP